jgi:hypothetical protein
MVPAVLDTPVSLRKMAKPLVVAKNARQHLVVKVASDVWGFREAASRSVSSLESQLSRPFHF